MMPRVAVLLLAPMVLCACRPKVHVVPGPAELTISLWQRADRDAGCTRSEPDTATVRARRAFAFVNMTDLRLDLYQNEADMKFATLAPGETSRPMMLDAPMTYRYFTAAPDVRVINARPCRVLVIQVIDGR